MCVNNTHTTDTSADHNDDLAYVHDLPTRVYVADTDFSGVVYHARYLEFFERGRSEFLRNIGCNNIELASGTQSPSGIQREKLFFVVHRIDITYSRPAHMDDLLTVKTRLEGVQGARFFMNQQIMRDNILLVEAKVTLAIMNQAGKPRRLPKGLFSSILVSK
ncbi:YbgC/FadM family acyl-CoA thioesterase [Bartonella sp. WD16.2]|uniref:YbgC/FadM family acyl-CoA thioesterase n=1 Tax=Bartonella sp. WD16.2 TaxID=1933904 RepID=UPI001F0042A9|nr:YbgC/FadM family acyl-CoA thioesterase [Bartonella sp. WD16.2]